MAFLFYQEDISQKLETFCRIVDHADAPLLLLKADPWTIVWANANCRTLLGEHRLTTLPVELEAVLGAYVVRSITAALEGVIGRPRAASPSLDCLTAVGRQTLRVALREVDDLPDHWLVTLSPTAPPPSGHWRQDLVQIIDLLPVGVEIYDEALNAVFYNKFSDALFSYQEQPVLHYEDWWEVGFFDDREREAARRTWAEHVAAVRANPDSTRQSEHWVRCADDQRRRLEFRFRVIEGKLVLIILDVTEQRLLEEELRNLGSIDPLTGALNRRGFFEMAETLLAHAGTAAETLCVLMLDIDHFKSINDRFGHAVGDEILSAVAARIDAARRPADLFVRLGGEEFALALPGRSGALARREAERVRRLIAQDPVDTTAGAIAVHISIGATEYAPTDTTLDDMLLRADRALYAAKRAGRNRFVWDGPNDEAQPPLDDRAM
ncbi:GGDEF domain-containing protein [Acuticoccus sp. M5D2P5]|uniref:GGDEF domain-containing protein n=1 Tax=Acuticoccus kalidii TaxID=2910977 RepID=UPI001F399E75|nr:GGDEF domain-containing protein [Acuticoccus kalidii]MCF3933406.1 GGDEF domain-containing protein [Acuticoccus kalidii]